MLNVRRYLSWNVPAEIAVGWELELAGVLGPVIHDLNVSRLQRAQVETSAATPAIKILAAEKQPEAVGWISTRHQHTNTESLKGQVCKIWLDLWLIWAKAWHLAHKVSQKKRIFAQWKQFGTLSYLASTFYIFLYIFLTIQYLEQKGSCSELPAVLDYHFFRKRLTVK